MNRRNVFRTAALALTATAAIPLLSPPTSAGAAADTSKGISVGMGYTNWLVTQSPAVQTSEFRTMVSTGAQSIRVDVGLGTNGAQWGWPISMISAAIAAGLRPLVILEDWSGGDYSTDGYIPWTGTISGQLARLGVHEFEIMNEVNLGGNETSKKANPSKYVAALRQIYPLIHAADPQSTVLHAGLAPYGQATGGAQNAGSGVISYNPFDYFTAMYTAGAKGYFDVANFHPYSAPFAPNASSVYNTMANLPTARNIMVANGDSAKQIMITEYGAVTSGGSSVSQETQAAWMTTAWAMVGSWPWCAGMYWFDWRDNTTDGAWGLETSTGAKKLAFTTFSQLTSGTSPTSTTTPATTDTTPSPTTSTPMTTTAPPSTTTSHPRTTAAPPSTTTSHPSTTASTTSVATTTNRWPYPIWWLFNIFG